MGEKETMTSTDATARMATTGDPPPGTEAAKVLPNALINARDDAGSTGNLAGASGPGDPQPAEGKATIKVVNDPVS